MCYRISATNARILDFGFWMGKRVLHSTFGAVIVAKLNKKGSICLNYEYSPGHEMKKG
jgi:hypothetical protein